MEVVMTLAEDLRKKYALTSLKLDGNCLALMAKRWKQQHRLRIKEMQQMWQAVFAV